MMKRTFSLLSVMTDLRYDDTMRASVNVLEIDRSRFEIENRDLREHRDANRDRDRSRRTVRNCTEASA